MSVAYRFTTASVFKIPIGVLRHRAFGYVNIVGVEFWDYATLSNFEFEFPPFLSSFVLPVGLLETSTLCRRTPPRAVDALSPDEISGRRWANPADSPFCVSVFTDGPFKS